jgi:hypothetical protein
MDNSFASWSAGSARATFARAFLRRTCFFSPDEEEDEEDEEEDEEDDEKVFARFKPLFAVLLRICLISVMTNPATRTFVRSIGSIDNSSWVTQ